MARGVTQCGSSSFGFVHAGKPVRKILTLPKCEWGEKRNRSAAKTKPAVTHSAPRLGKCRVHEMYLTYGYTKQSNAIMFAIRSIDYIA